jgi:hypothetical protein
MSVDGRNPSVRPGLILEDILAPLPHGFLSVPHFLRQLIVLLVVFQQNVFAAQHKTL